MEKKFKLLLIASLLLTGTVTNATEEELMVLPSLPSKVINLDSVEEYSSGDWLEKANKSYEIFHVLEEPDVATIQRGIELLLEAIQAGDPCSLEELANMALYGRYNVPKNIEWAIDALIYLTDNGHELAWNSLNAIDVNAVKLLEEGNRQEARQLFVKTWTERRF